ncbi:MAG: hypothetical protein FK730_07620 [Asgard group archaeon]|nr:hypothetical protein [Asgard group archaeon]
MFTCFIVGKPIEIESTFEPFFTLVAKTNVSINRYTILNFVKQHLGRIGIEVIPIEMEWGSFLTDLFTFHDFDLCFLDFFDGEADPDWSKVFGENGALNIWGYNTSIDWDEELGTGKNEWYLQQGKIIIPPDSEERIHHYWNWEQYMMDKILPLQPMFSPVNYITAWSNLQGYEDDKGLKASWGKLSWDSLHEGQKNSTEIIITGSSRNELNPLFRFSIIPKDSIPYLVFDSLITYDEDLNFYPHLAQDWTFLNDTHLRMNLRQNIKWQTDLDGFFQNEYFDADDVIFSFYAWKHISDMRGSFSWLENVKKVDKYTVDFFIDQDSSTPENEPYAPLFKYIVREILPEHYLNQTQLADGKTPDITHESWTTFSANCFGTSLFELASFLEVESNLQLFEECWWLDPSVDKTGMDFENRFGDFSGGISKLKMRIIEDTDQMYAQFELGQLDIINLQTNLYMKEKLQENPSYTIYEVNPFCYSFLGYNLREDRQIIGNREPAPGDSNITVGLAIRKAISHAIDRDEINQVLFGGNFILQDYPIYQNATKWCNPNIIRYNHDLDKAREYMRIAGYGEPLPSPWNPWEITGLVLTSALVVGTISFNSYRIYKKNKV